MSHKLDFIAARVCSPYFIIPFLGSMSHVDQAPHLYSSLSKPITIWWPHAWITPLGRVNHQDITFLGIINIQSYYYTYMWPYLVKYSPYNLEGGLDSSWGPILYTKLFKCVLQGLLNNHLGSPKSSSISYFWS